MSVDRAYGKGARMLTLEELCQWLNITERHARKLVERDAIPYRKVGHLLRFPEAEIEEWSHPARRTRRRRVEPDALKPSPIRKMTRSALPKSLIELVRQEAINSSMNSCNRALLIVGLLNGSSLGGESSRQGEWDVERQPA